MTKIGETTPRADQIGAQVVTQRSDAYRAAPHVGTVSPQKPLRRKRGKGQKLP